MSLVCTGYNCPKSNTCGRCINHLSSEFYNEVNTVESLSSFGSCSISSEGIKENWWCGPNGGYKMFEPLYTPATKTEIEILEKALQQAVSDRNYLAEQIYLGAVDCGKLSVDYYIEQAKRRIK